MVHEDNWLLPEETNLFDQYHELLTEPENHYCDSVLEQYYSLPILLSRVGKEGGERMSASVKTNAACSVNIGQSGKHSVMMQSVKGFLSLFFALSDYSSLVFRNRGRNRKHICKSILALQGWRCHPFPRVLANFRLILLLAP
jgi:hypothetical protein